MVKNRKILVIEDEAQTRTNLATILTMEGFEALSAPDGAAGVELARTVVPDLILCDVMMPVMDGYAVLKALRADERTLSIPFVFLTARGEKRDVRLGMDLGADDYLCKPASADELLSAVQARLMRQQEQQDAALQRAEFKPDFTSPKPLENLGLSPHEAEVLLWMAQGKSNGEIGAILGLSEKAVKVHADQIFEKLGTDNRKAATVRAIEVLSGPARRTAPEPC